MSELRKAAQQALDYLDTPTPKIWPGGTQHKIITDLRAALAQPEPEPVAWRITDGEGDWEYFTDLPEDWSIQWSARYGRKYEPLYTTPPQRKPLTEEEIADAANSVRWSQQYHLEFARAIEAAHGIGGEA